MIESHKLHSASLAGNPQKNSPIRHLSVYLPPSYNQSKHSRFPVVYLLHGSYQTDSLWFGKGYLKNLNIEQMLNDLIERKLIEPMIVVMPNCKTNYNGSWYSDSNFTGHWEQFLTTEVLPFIDKHYKTKPQPDCRAIAGHSMGGYGAVKIGMKNPELFGAIYSMSGLLSLEEAFLGVTQRTKTLDACAAAWSPNCKKTCGYDVPFSGQAPNRKKDDVLWDKWKRHDPVALLDCYNSRYKQSLFFDCGAKDDLIHANEHFSKALSKKGVQHQFYRFEGSHISHTLEHMRTMLFPYLSKQFSTVPKSKPIQHHYYLRSAQKVVQKVENEASQLTAKAKKTFQKRL